MEADEENVEAYIERAKRMVGTSIPFSEIVAVAQMLQQEAHTDRIESMLDRVISSVDAVEGAIG